MVVEDNSPAPTNVIRLRSLLKRVWLGLLNALSGPGGLDDAAFPSSFKAPHARGSRAVRSLWHIPF
jgi:hypothetical protein